MMFWGVPETFPHPPAEWGDTGSLRRCAWRSVQKQGAGSAEVHDAVAHPEYLEWVLRCERDGQATFVVARRNLFGARTSL